MQWSLPFDPDLRLPLVRDRLRALYGPQRDALRHDPTAQFFKAMISSRTLDALSQAAFDALRGYLRSWDALADADPAVIVFIVKDVTDAGDKAPRLVAAAQIIKTRYGRVDLAFLTGWNVADAFSWLNTLPGAGPKVSAATLNFSTLRKRDFAVDRHVLRLSQRLGLVKGNADFVRGHRMLMHLMPDDWDADDLYELHWLMKMHGQTVCRAHSPACATCSLVSLCNAVS
jgi:endonuclease-3